MIYSDTIKLAPPTTDISILEKLSDDEEWKLRESVARNLYTPITILAKLSNDKDWGVSSLAVLNNPNILHESRTLMIMIMKY